MPLNLFKKFKEEEEEVIVQRGNLPPKPTGRSTTPPKPGASRTGPPAPIERTEAPQTMSGEEIERHLSQRGRGLIAPDGRTVVGDDDPDVTTAFWKSMTFLKRAMSFATAELSGWSAAVMLGEIHKRRFIQDAIGAGKLNLDKKLQTTILGLGDESLMISNNNPLFWVLGHGKDAQKLIDGPFEKMAKRTKIKLSYLPEGQEIGKYGIGFHSPVLPKNKKWETVTTNLTYWDLIQYFAEEQESGKTRVEELNAQALDLYLGARLKGEIPIVYTKDDFGNLQPHYPIGSGVARLWGAKYPRAAGVAGSVITFGFPTLFDVPWMVSTAKMAWPKHIKTTINMQGKPVSSSRPASGSTSSVRFTDKLSPSGWGPTKTGPKKPSPIVPIRPSPVGEFGNILKASKFGRGVLNIWNNNAATQWVSGWFRGGSDEYMIGKTSSDASSAQSVAMQEGLSKDIAHMARVGKHAAGMAEPGEYEMRPAEYKINPDLHTNKDLTDDAVSEFGYTTDPTDAGFMHPDNTLLDMRTPEAKRRGTHGPSHLQIGKLYGKDVSVDRTTLTEDGIVINVSETPGFDINEGELGNAISFSKDTVYTKPKGLVYDDPELMASSYQGLTSFWITNSGKIIVAPRGHDEYIRELMAKRFSELYAKETEGVEVEPVLNEYGEIDTSPSTVRMDRDEVMRFATATGWFRGTQHLDHIGIEGWGNKLTEEQRTTLVEILGAQMARYDAPELTFEGDWGSFVAAPGMRIGMARFNEMLDEHMEIPDPEKEFLKQQRLEKYNAEHEEPMVVVMRYMDDTSSIRMIDAGPGLYIELSKPPTDRNVALIGKIAQKHTIEQRNLDPDHPAQLTVDVHDELIGKLNLPARVTAKGDGWKEEDFGDYGGLIESFTFDNPTVVDVDELFKDVVIPYEVESKPAVKVAVNRSKQDLRHFEWVEKRIRRRLSQEDPDTVRGTWTEIRRRVEKAGRFRDFLHNPENIAWLANVPPKQLEGYVGHFENMEAMLDYERGAGESPFFPNDPDYKVGHPKGLFDLIDNFLARSEELKLKAGRITDDTADYYGADKDLKYFPRRIAGQRTAVSKTFGKTKIAASRARTHETLEDSFDAMIQRGFWPMLSIYEVLVQDMTDAHMAWVQSNTEKAVNDSGAAPIVNVRRPIVSAEGARRFLTESGFSVKKDDKMYTVHYKGKGLAIISGEEELVKHANEILADPARLIRELTQSKVEGKKRIFTTSNLESLVQTLQKRPLGTRKYALYYPEGQYRFYVQNARRKLSELANVASNEDIAHIQNLINNVAGTIGSDYKDYTNFTEAVEALENDEIAKKHIFKKVFGMTKVGVPVNLVPLDLYHLIQQQNKTFSDPVASQLMQWARFPLRIFMSSVTAWNFAGFWPKYFLNNLFQVTDGGLPPHLLPFRLEQSIQVLMKKGNVVLPNKWRIPATEAYAMMESSGVYSAVRRLMSGSENLKVLADFYRKMMLGPKARVIADKIFQTAPKALGKNDDIWRGASALQKVSDLIRERNMTPENSTMKDLMELFHQAAQHTWEFMYHYTDMPRFTKPLKMFIPFLSFKYHTIPRMIKFLLSLHKFRLFSAGAIDLQEYLGIPQNKWLAEYAKRSPLPQFVRKMPDGTERLYQLKIAWPIYSYLDFGTTQRYAKSMFSITQPLFQAAMTQANMETFPETRFYPTTGGEVYKVPMPLSMALASDSFLNSPEWQRMLGLSFDFHGKSGKKYLTMSKKALDNWYYINPWAYAIDNNFKFMKLLVEDVKIQTRKGDIDLREVKTARDFKALQKDLQDIEFMKMSVGKHKVRFMPEDKPLEKLIFQEIDVVSSFKSVLRDEAKAYAKVTQWVMAQPSSDLKRLRFNTPAHFSKLLKDYIEAKNYILWLTSASTEKEIQNIRNSVLIRQKELQKAIGRDLFVEFEDDIVPLSPD